MKHLVSRLAPGSHFRVHLDSRVHCFLFSWNLKNIDSKAEGGKTGVKCASWNEALCFTKQQNCLLKFHVSQLFLQFLQFFIVIRCLHRNLVTDLSHK